VQSSATSAEEAILAVGDGMRVVIGSGAAAPIVQGNLLLVIQMQDADFDSSNTNAYGHGGAPAAPASGWW